MHNFNLFIILNVDLPFQFSKNTTFIYYHKNAPENF